MIRVRMPERAFDLDDADQVRTVQQVAGNAVARVLRNPEGYRSEGVGGVSYTLDTRAAAGFLTILDEEWRLLGLAPAIGGAFSFGPTLGTASYPTLPDRGWWGPWL